jgi:hypothetical protein
MIGLCTEAVEVDFASASFNDSLFQESGAGFISAPKRPQFEQRRQAMTR